MKYTKLVAAPVPQGAPLDRRQVMNNAGGYVFQIDDWGGSTASWSWDRTRRPEGAAALAMTTMRTERNWHVMAFADGLRPLPLTATMSLSEVLRHTRIVNFGGTDCALPMLYALEQGLGVDVFVVLTDNETWAGKVHPTVALREYRRKTGIPAKLIVVGMTATGFSIADPNDGGMLDVVGFDSAAPAVMADFAR
jgi:60 kDa SS-A/Ro ribonucleoprotein